MTSPRSEADHAQVLMRHDIVLVPGGLDAPHENVASTDLYDPKTGTWTAGGPMSEPRSGHAALALKGNHGVIVMGGLDVGPAATASVDIGTSR